jgi:hypothetical protein
MDYSYATTLVEGAFWGYKAGCDFVQNKCIDPETGDLVNSATHDREFCSIKSVERDGTGYKCSPSAMFKTYCDIGLVSDQVPSWYNYGPDNFGGSEWSQFCPSYFEDIDSDCFNASSNQRIPVYNAGEYTGESSRCFESTFGSFVSPQATCYSVQCFNSGTEYSITITSTQGTSVRTLSTMCTTFGQQILDDEGEYPGYIICADPLVICSGFNFPHLEQSDIGDVQGALPADGVQIPTSSGQIPEPSKPITTASSAYVHGCAFVSSLLLITILLA